MKHQEKDPKDIKGSDKLNTSMAGGKNPNPKKEESKKEEQKDNFSLEFINTSSLGGVRKVFNNAPNGDQHKVTSPKNSLNTSVWGNIEETSNLFSQGSNYQSYNQAGQSKTGRAQNEVKKGPQEIRLFALFKFNKPSQDAKSAKFQVMMHKNDFNEKRFVELEPELIQFGQGSFNVYSNSVQILENYKKDFQPRLVIERSYGIQVNWDYYEKFGHMRPFRLDSPVQFIFGLKIVRNDSHLRFKDVPGENIKEPMMELIYFTQYLLETGQIDLMQELIRQYKVEYRQAGPSADQTKIISELCDTLISQRMEELEVFLPQMLTILGLLPHEMKAIKDFKLPSSPQILINGLKIVRDEVETLKNEAMEIQGSDNSIFNRIKKINNLIIQGYIFVMLADYSNGNSNWYDSIVELQDVDPLSMCVLADKFLNKLSENRQKIKKEAIENLLKIFSTKANELSQMNLSDIQSLVLLLLEQANDLRHFISFLRAIYEPSIQSSLVDQQQDQLSIFQQTEQTQTQILKKINKFIDVYILGLQQIFDFLKMMKDEQQASYFYLFQKSDARLIITRILNVHEFGGYAERDLELLNKILLAPNITLFIPNVQEAIKNLLIKLFWTDNNLRYLKDAYKYLLRPFQNWVLTLEYAGKYFRFINSKSYDIPDLITQNVKLIDEYIAQCPAIQDKEFRYEEQFIKDLCEDAVKALHEKCVMHAQKSLSDYNQLMKVNNCKNQYFVKAYKQMVVKAVILPALGQRQQMNQGGKQQNPLILDSLILTHQKFKANGSDETLIKELLDLAFQQANERPSKEQVFRTLIDDPRIDHHWFRFIERFADYKQYESVVHIHKVISEFLRNIIEQKFSLQDIISLKNHTNAQKDALLRYLMVIQQGNQNKEEGILNREALSDLLRGQIDQVVKITKKIDEIRTYLYSTVKLDKTHMLSTVFETHTKDYLKKQYQELAVFPPELESYMEIAQKIYSLQYSEIFQNYMKMAEKKEEANQQLPQLMMVQENEATAADQVRKNCETAYEKLQGDLQAFVTDENETKIKAIKEMMGAAQLNKNAIQNEIQEFIKLFPRNVQAEQRLRELGYILNAIGQRDKYRILCQGLIYIASMQCSFKDLKNNGEERIAKIFNLDVTEELKSAEMYIDVCIVNFHSTSVTDFTQIHKITSERIIQKIEERIRYQLNKYDQNKGKIPDKEVQKAFQDNDQLKINDIFGVFKPDQLTLFQFLRLMSDNELEQLRDFVNDYDEVDVSTQTILDSMSVWDYIHELNGKTPKKFDELIDFMLDSQHQNPKFHDIDRKIKQCSMHVLAIQDLKNTFLNKEEAKKKQIIHVVDSSLIKFISTEDSLLSWDICVKYQRDQRIKQEKLQEEKKFKLDEIGELRDRALLIQNTLSQQKNQKNDKRMGEESQKNQQEQIQMSTFVQLAKLIQSTIQNLTLLFQSGYPTDQIDFITQEFECKQSKFVELQQFEQKVALILKLWQISLIQCYEEFYLLTFLSGGNIWILEKYLLGERLDQGHTLKAQNILNYMGKTDVDGVQFREFITAKNLKGNNINIFQLPKHRLKRLGSFLETLEFNNTRSFDKQDSKNFSFNSQDGRKEAILKIVVKEDEIMYLETQRSFVGIISIFINSGKTFPRADQLFFCNDSVKWEEIQSFMYRCLKNPNKELHCMVNPDQLTLEMQDKLIALIQKFIKEEFAHNNFFSFAVIVGDGKSRVSNFIKIQPCKKIVKDQLLLNDEKIQEIIKSQDQTTVFVTSKTTGLGKTHFIKQQEAAQKRKTVFFPLAGTLDLNQIGQRLSKIQGLDKKNLAFQINFVDSMDLLNEILINLALFRVFKSSSHIVVIPKQCSIFIELSNTLGDTFENQIIYRKYLREREHRIEDFDIKRLSIKQGLKLYPIRYNIDQYICKYLAMIDQAQGDPQLANLTMDDNELTAEDCTKLIHKHFVESQKKIGQEPNFIQLEIFKNILYTLIKNFEMSSFFMPEQLEWMTQDMVENGLKNLAPEIQTLRKTLLNALLTTVKQFTVKSLDRNVRVSQEQANVALRQMRQKNEEMKIEEAKGHPVIEAQYEMRLNWEKTKHFYIIFCDDGSFMPIYKDPNQVPEEFRKLIYIQSNITTNGQELSKRIAAGNYQIDDLSKFTDYRLVALLQNFKTHSQYQVQSDPDYVVTTDNFLKMCIIYLRVISKVPVIIMGETGCGKTSLIRFFSQTILNDKLEIFNIHAGITSKIIIDKMNEFIETAKKLLDNAKKLWIFFDEFNTTENLGLICEILTSRTLLGNPIPENIVLLAACNPYKLRVKKNKFDENVGIKRANAQNRLAQNALMYTVNPLPDNIIEYVWDFGALTELDYKKYISNMLTRAQIENVEMMTAMIIACHKYFGENEDKSSVSLRDVSRFIILYKWFKESLLNKKNIELKHSKLSQQSVKYQANVEKFKLKFDDYSVISLKEMEVRACILAMAHCYYLRLSNLKDREEFLARICKSQKQLPALTPKKVIDYLNYESNDYILRMDLEEGIAVNLALKENVFAIIPCVMNKIPIFICGKPGCSKSMAISLVFENLKGDKSTDPFFKQLDSLIMVSFQGSDSCTSDGILKAYDKARKYLEDQSQKNLLPVFVFDEIGLAELSKYNPLKVLHSLLELENRKIAFIGISNWRLDASKMNRALYLARPDPDQNDLKDTALSIYQQLCPGKDNSRTLMITNLANSYYELKQQFVKTQPEFADFYGLRDFYHLIKHVARDIQRNGIANREELAAIAKMAIDRNFGGKLHANEIMGKIFAKHQGIEEIYQNIPHCDVRQLIDKNMADKNSRYLMLIGRSDVLTYILEQQFRKRFKHSRIMVGSHLENDVSKEEYGFKSLSDIILLMEKGIPIILNGMDHIESSLYDLFNQKFAISGENRFCRIALGAQLNPQCFVHNDFHCVIFMDDNDELLKAKDAPLLNRFEKHHIKLENILTENQKYVINEVKGWIDQLLKMRYKENPILLNATSLFPNYSSDTLGLLVLNEYELANNNDVDVELMIIRCKEKLIESATQDILILAKTSNIPGEEAQFIFDTYAKAHRMSFHDRLRDCLNRGGDIENNISKKLITFTYSMRLDLSPIQNNETLILSRSVTNFKSEAELVKTLQQFFDSKRQNVLIIEANYMNDKQHLSFIKFIVDKVEKQNMEDKGWDGCKTVILLVHMQRNYNENDFSSLPLFESWGHRVYYDIDPQSSFDFSQQLLDKNIRQIIQEERIADFRSLIGPLTEKCLLKLNFEGEISSETQDEINSNIFFIIEKISSNDQLIDTFKAKIFTSIAKQLRIIDWKDHICSNPEVFNESTNVEAALKKVIEINIEGYLTKLLFHLEKESAFRSYFTQTRNFEADEILQNIWIRGFNRLKFEDIQLQNLPSSNYTTYFSNLQFPFIREEARMLAELITEQRKYEIENQQSPTIKEDKLDFFALNFLKRSKIGEEFIKQIVDERELQKIYLQDIVKIFLIESFFKPEYFKIVMLIINKIMKDTIGTFYDKLYTFLMKKQLFFSLCQVLDTFMMIQKGKEDLSLALLEEVFEQALDEFIDASWEEMTGAIIDQDIIKGCYPDVRSLQELGSVNNLAHLIEKLFRSLLQMEQEVKLKNTNIIKFWSDYTSLIATLGGVHYHFLIECSNDAQKLDEQNEGRSFLDHPLFINKILTYFEDPKLLIQGQNNQLPDSVMKFMASYFTILWESNPVHLFVYIERLDLPQYQKLYTYSSALFQKVIGFTKIDKTIKAFAQDISEQVQDAELQVQQNDYSEVLGEIFAKDQNLESKFSKAICDFLVKFIGKDMSIKDLLSLVNQFHQYLRLARDQDSGNLKKLISHAFMKAFINYYAELIFSIQYLDQEVTEEINQCLEDVNVILMGNNAKQVVKTLQLYFMKNLKSMLHCNASQFKEHLIKDFSQQLQWIQHCDIIQIGGMNQDEQQAIDVYPFIEEIAQQEGQLMTLFEITMKTNQNAYREQVKNKFKELEKREDFIRLGLATMKNFYLKYASKQNAKNPVCTPEFSQFYQQELEQILEVKQGKQFSILIGCLIRNFPRDNYLNLSPNQDQNELHYKVISCYQLLLLLSSSKEMNPLTGLYFRNLGQQFSIANVNKSFIIGLELEYKHTYLMNLHLNFQTLRNQNGNGSYACGGNCDYVYIVLECGNVTHAAKCPWCGNDIGGKVYGVLEQRAGHRRLNDAEAIQLIAGLVAKYNNTQKMGYFNVNTPSEDPFLTQNGIRPITWRLMRTFIHTSLYFFMTVGGSNDQEFQQILNQQQLIHLNKRPRDFLEGHIQNDFKILFKQLSSAGNDCQPAWIYSVLNSVPEVLNRYKNQGPDNFNVTQNFFRDFDQMVVGQKTEKIAEISQAFKQKVIQVQNRQSAKFEMIIQELEMDNIEFPYLNLYRLTKDYSFEDMRASFKNTAQNDQSFPLLKVCLENYDQMIKLRQLQPIIEFTNYMVNRYSHMTTRDNARHLILSDAIKETKEDGEMIQRLFGKFKKAWSRIGFEAQIQYGCKVNPYIKEYTEKHELSFFLLDNKEVGGGMCLAAGLQELAKIQNNILNQIVTQYSQRNNMNADYVIDHYKYPPQRMKQDHILNFNIDHQSTLRLCSLSNLKYGEGQQLVYDFGRLEGNIVKDLINKKLMNEEHFEFIQYQLEIMIINGERSNFITEIRQKIPQRSLDKPEKIQLDQYLSHADAQKLKVLHGGLDKILCFLQNSTIEKNKVDNFTIEEFCRRIHGQKEKEYSDRSVLSQIKLVNIIDLYQTIEVKYFPHITHALRQEFFNMKKEEQIKDSLSALLKHCDLKKVGGEAVNEDGLIPPREDLQYALMRFMIRCLAGELDPKQPLSLYINGTKEDLWDEELLQDHQAKFDNLDRLIPVDINMEDIYCTYTVISKLNTIYNQNRPLGPVLQPVAPAPVRLQQQKIARPPMKKIIGREEDVQ